MPRTLLMTTQAGRAEHAPESEPVIIDTDTPDVVRLCLDDGEEITLDRTELRAAIGEDHEQLEAA